MRKPPLTAFRYTGVAAAIYSFRPSDFSIKQHEECDKHDKNGNDDGWIKHRTNKGKKNKSKEKRREKNPEVNEFSMSHK